MSQANVQWYDYKSSKGARQELISSQCTLKYYVCGFDDSNMSRMFFFSENFRMVIIKQILIWPW